MRSQNRIGTPQNGVSQGYHRKDTVDEVHLRSGYGSKSNHQEMGRRFWSMFPGLHFGVTLFLTTTV